MVHSKEWLPSRLIEPQIVLQLPYAQSSTVSTTLPNQLTVGTADPIALAAVLSYLLHVVSHAQCCEGVSSTRYPQYYKCDTATICSHNTLGFPFQSKYLPTRFNARSGDQRVAVLEPAFPSHLPSGHTTIDAVASTLRSVQCAMFSALGQHAGNVCTACCAFRDNTLSSVFKTTSAQFDHIIWLRHR